MLDLRIKTGNALVSRVDLICDRICKEVHATKKESEVTNKFQKSKDIMSYIFNLGIDWKKLLELWEKLYV